MRSSIFQWLLVEFFYCLHVLTLTAYAVGADSLRDQLKLSSAEMGSLAAVFFMAFGISQLLVGSQLGKFPSRLIFGCSAAAATLGSLLLLISDSFLSALIARLLMGAGVGNALVNTVYVVSERFPARFPLMANISQSAANLSGAAFGFAVLLVPSLMNINVSYQFGFFFFLVDTVLIFAYCRDGFRARDGKSLSKGLNISLVRRVSRILALQYFWKSLIFYAGLFGSYLSFAEVWNIQFLINVFHESVGHAYLINTFVIFGLAIGNLASGTIADRFGYLWPSRFGAVTSLMLLLLLLIPNLPLWLFVSAQFSLGLGMGSACLGLTALRCSIPISDFPLASALMLTGVFAIAALLSAAVGLNSTFLTNGIANFVVYQRAMLFIVVFVAMSVASAISMRPQPKAVQ
jgi:MFS family permease